MSTRREILTGLIAALISVVVLAGSLLVANTETRATVAQVLAPTPSLTPIPTQIILVTPLPGEPTYTPSPSPLPSSTPAEALAACPPLAGWAAITVQAGDTLESLAQTYNTTVKALKQANCLSSNTLYPGTLLYVPATQPPTQIPCGPPPGWVYYIVQPGDTLYSLSRAYGVSVAALQAANCMGSSTYIRAGQKLYVPNVTPNFTPTPWVTPSPQLSATQTLIPPSATFTSVPPSPTLTSAIPSSTPVNWTNTPTITPVTPTATEIPASPTPTATFTPLPPSATPTPLNTPTTPPTSTARPPTDTPLPTLAVP